MFIIYPKHIFYYKMFQKYQNIENKYFHAINLLVKNTKAKVWIFYGKNSIILNRNNFDQDGSHFKPKISNIIYASIFNDDSVSVPQEFGVQLTIENIDEYLGNLKKQIKN